MVGAQLQGPRAGKRKEPWQAMRRGRWARRCAPAVWLLLAALLLQANSVASSATMPAGARPASGGNVSATNTSECELQWVCTNETHGGNETHGAQGASKMSEAEVKHELKGSRPKVHLISHGGHSPGGEMVGLFLLVMLVIGCLIRLGLENLKARWGIGIPSSVMLLFVGVVIGGSTWEVIIAADGEPTEPLSLSIMMWTWMDLRLILFMFLPALIFEGAMTTDYFIFKEQFAGGAMLAGPGMVFQIVLIATWAVYVFPYGWGWTESFLFGGILSATDPVAVIALMKEMALLSDLRVLLEAESLMNDGTAIVVFELCVMILLEPSTFLQYFGMGCQVSHVKV
jgi:hypothetical protein